MACITELSYVSWTGFERHISLLLLVAVRNEFSIFLAERGVVDLWPKQGGRKLEDVNNVARDQVNISRVLNIPHHTLTK